MRVGKLVNKFYPDDYSAVSSLNRVRSVVEIKENLISAKFTLRKLECSEQAVVM